MSIKVGIPKIMLTAATLILIAGCKTEFDKFDAFVLEGMDSGDIELALNKYQINYRYLSCLDLKGKISSLKQGCTASESNGVYVGWVNNGAYILGMGSTDVYFEVEIGKDNKVVGVYTDEIYTFL